MHNFFVLKYLDILKLYITYKKKSTHFGLEVSVVYVISSLYVLNCFKYFGTKRLKTSEKKNLELYQVFLC